MWRRTKSCHVWYLIKNSQSLKIDSFSRKIGAQRHQSTSRLLQSFHLNPSQVSKKENDIPTTISAYAPRKNFSRVSSACRSWGIDPRQHDIVAANDRAGVGVTETITKRIMSLFISLRLNTLLRWCKPTQQDVNPLARLEFKSLSNSTWKEKIG